MSSVVTALTGGGPNGANFQASSANILNPATTQQAQDQYNQAQNAISQQQSFVNAVGAQNGLGNQSSVFNQLQGVANGTGPNPAAAQLAQSTGANVANQASLMAGQRGSGANAGLIARQAAQQGASTQQQAAGQAATLQANQSLNALGQEGSLATSQANQQASALQGLNAASQGEQGQVLGAIQGQNQANVANTQSQNSANAQISAVNAKSQSDLVGNLMGGAGSAMGLAKGGMVPQKYADGGGTYQPVDPNNSPFNSPAPSQPAAITPLPGVSMAQPTTTPPNVGGPKSKAGQFFSNPSPQAPQQLTGASAAGNTIGKAIGSGLSAIGNAIDTSVGITDYGKAVKEGSDEIDQANADSANQDAGGGGGLASKMVAKGGKINALVSPGEIWLSPNKAKAVAAGKADPMKVGEKIPGKAPVSGARNDYANDIVPKKLEVGGVVVPRSETQSTQPRKNSIEFVASTMAKKGRLPKKAK
jgi:hypothetical protein